MKVRSALLNVRVDRRCFPIRIFILRHSRVGSRALHTDMGPQIAPCGRANNGAGRRGRLLQTRRRLPPALLPLHLHPSEPGGPPRSGRIVRCCWRCRCTWRNAYRRSPALLRALAGAFLGDWQCLRFEAQIRRRLLHGCQRIRLTTNSLHGEWFFNTAGCRQRSLLSGRVPSGVLFDRCSSAAANRQFLQSPPVHGRHTLSRLRRRTCFPPSASKAWRRSFQAANVRSVVRCCPQVTAQPGLAGEQGGEQPMSPKGHSLSCQQRENSPDCPARRCPQGPFGAKTGRVPPAILRTDRKKLPLKA